MIQDNSTEDPESSSCSIYTILEVVCKCVSFNFGSVSRVQDQTLGHIYDQSLIWGRTMMQWSHVLNLDTVWTSLGLDGCLNEVS